MKVATTQSSLLRERLQRNWPSEETQKAVAYLKLKKVPIDDLIFVLEQAYRINWRKIDEANPPLRDEIRDWLIAIGCTHNLARALQEIIRPQKYQRNKGKGAVLAITKAAETLRFQK